ncbi:MAG: hypothetical protein HY923_06385 [Elusimicrobia bacterium]|nr:hypothetical protein [Elusimicrobiota bacterium]
MTPAVAVPAFIPAGAKATPAVAMAAAQALTGAIAAAKADKRDEAPALATAFDGLKSAPSAEDSDAPEVPAAQAPLADGAKLGRLYPRVVVILDTLDKPATKEDKIVKHIETLVTNGVKVVFVTARPEKGENSAESMLVGQLKVRTGNPVLVVSYNGARVTSHSSRAENPKPLIPDQLPFAEKTVARFREITADVNAKLGVKGKSSEFGQPSLEAPFIYGGTLPQGVDAAKWSAAFNRSLKAAGFAYKIELSKNAEGETTWLTQSTALKLNANRVFNAVYAAAPELNPELGGAGILKPQQVLILADPAKAPSFLQALPGKGYFIHGVSDTSGLERAMEAVLGGKALDQVAVNKYELRDYIEWLSRRQRYGSSSAPQGKGGRAGVIAPRRSGDASGFSKVPFYRGIIVKEVMSRLYHLMKNGAYEESTLDAGIDLLEKLWKYPEANGIHLPEELKLGRQTGAFKAQQKGGLEGSKRWLKNYYHRHFPDFPRGVNQKVAGRLLRLARDGDSVTLQYESPYTGRSYKVFVRPDRTELWEDEKGYILVAHVYRTGKEPYQKGFDENIEVNLIGRALLEGDAQKRADGRWYVNGEADPRIQVVFHYMTRDLQAIMTPEQVDSHTPEVTALIEKRENDKEYQKWVEAKKIEEEKARINLKRNVTRTNNLKEKEKKAKNQGGK